MSGIECHSGTVCIANLVEGKEGFPLAIQSRMESRATGVEATANLLPISFLFQVSRILGSVAQAREPPSP